jgi:hypothetical protein
LITPLSSTVGAFPSALGFFFFFFFLRTISILEMRAVISE